MSLCSVQQAARVLGIRRGVSLSPRPKFGLRAKKDDIYTHFSVNRHTAKYPPDVSNYLAYCMHDVTHDPRRVPEMLDPEVQSNSILRNDKNYLPCDTTRFSRIECSTVPL